MLSLNVMNLDLFYKNRFDIFWLTKDFQNHHRCTAIVLNVLERIRKNLKIFSYIIQ